MKDIIYRYRLWSRTRKYGPAQIDSWPRVNAKKLGVVIALMVLLMMQGCITVEEKESASSREVASPTDGESEVTDDPIDESFRATYSFSHVFVTESGQFHVEGRPFEYEGSLEVSGTQATMITEHEGCQITRVFSNFSPHFRSVGGDVAETYREDSISCLPEGCEQRFFMPSVSGGTVELIHRCQAVGEPGDIVFEMDYQDYDWAVVGGYSFSRLGRSEFQFKKEK